MSSVPDLILVSVIIPCYNVQDYITECVNSVLAQTYRNIEIICVDNNSADSTVEILEALKTNHPTLSVLKEKKPGANAARNKGLSVARGEWVQFLDADDLLQPEKIEHQLKLLKSADRQTGFIAGASTRINVNKNEVHLGNFHPTIFLAPFINASGNTCANLWNRQALTKAGNWNEQIRSSQETELMLRMVLSGSTFMSDPVALTVIRDRPEGQISQRNPGDKWKQYIDIRLDYLQSLQLHHQRSYEENKSMFYDFLMTSLLILARYDQPAALQYYTSAVKKNWIAPGSYGFNRLKAMLIKFFGFKLFLNYFTLTSGKK